MDCFVARAPRNDEEIAEFVGYISSRALRMTSGEFEPIGVMEAIVQLQSPSDVMDTVVKHDVTAADRKRSLQT